MPVNFINGLRPTEFMSQPEALRWGIELMVNLARNVDARA